MNLPPEDVKPAVMGESGADIKLSASAKEVFPFSLECKNQERLNIWQALEQAEGNSGFNLYPAVIFKRNHSEIYIAMEFEDFLEIWVGK